MSASAQRINVRVLLEGIAVPSAGVSVTAGVGEPSQASIDLLPHDTLFALKPRTQVLIFYLHTQGVPDVDETDHTRTDDSALRHWRLLFAGETYNEGESITGSSRSYRLEARGHMGALSREFLFTTTYSGTGGKADATVISDRSRFFGTLMGLVDDIGNDPATIILRAYQERTPLSPGIKENNGPLAGLMTLLEWQFGVHGTYAGVNHFATLYGRISRLLDQIVTDRGGAAAKLYDQTVFEKWLKNQSSDLGIVINLETITNLVCSYIQYQHISCPVANFTPGSNAKPFITLPPAAAATPTTEAATTTTADTGSATPVTYDAAALNNVDMSILVKNSKVNIAGMKDVAVWYVARLMTALKLGGRPAKIVSGYRSPEEQFRLTETRSGPHVDRIAADITAISSRSGGAFIGSGYNSSFGRTQVAWNQKEAPSTWTKAKWALKQTGAKHLSQCIGLQLRGSIRLDVRYTVQRKLDKLNKSDPDYQAKYDAIASKAAKFNTATPSANGPLSPYTFSQADYNIMYDAADFYRLIVSSIEADPVLRSGLLSGAQRGFGLYGSPDGDPTWESLGVYGSDPVHVQLRPNARIPSSLPTATTISIPTGAPAPVPVAPAVLPGSIAPEPPAPDVLDTPRSRLHTDIFLPDLWFCAAPLCNVVFPDEIGSLNTNRPRMSVVTRLELETHDAIKDDGSGSFLNTRDVFYAPQLQTALAPNGTVISNLTAAGLQTAALGQDKTPVIYAHEKFSGIIPRQEFFGDYSIGAQVDDIAAESGVTKDDAYATLASAIAAWHLIKQRVEPWTMNIEMKFTPRLVPGFPIVVLRKGKDDSTGLPLAYLGQIRGITHSIDASSASTQVQITHVRTHRLESNQDDLFAHGLRLANQRPGGVQSGYIKFSNQMSRDEAEFVDRIYALAGGGAIVIPYTKAGGTPPAANNYTGGQLAGLKSPSGGEVLTLSLFPCQETVAEAAPPPGGYGMAGKSYDVAGDIQIARHMQYRDSTSGPQASEAVPEGEGTAAVLKDVLPPRFDPLFRIDWTEQLQTVGVPLEEAIRPVWMGEDYTNTNIGPKIYKPILGCDSIIDRIAGDPYRTEYAMPCIEDAVSSLVQEYLSVSGGGFLAREWVDAMTDRPVATMADLVGTDGFFTWSTGPRAELEGLDLDIPLLRRATLFSKKSSGGSAANATNTTGAATGASDAIQCDPALDPRAERYNAVAAYVGATHARTGLRG